MTPIKPAIVRRTLLQLIRDAETCLAAFDSTMKGPATEKRGRQLAQICNGLEQAKDCAKLTVGLKIDRRLK